MQELLVIGAVLMLFFGPSQLPKLGKSIGQTIKEFKSAGKELRKSIDGEDEIE
jgi:sec-independent protein translocase protein TatA